MAGLTGLPVERIMRAGGAELALWSRVAERASELRIQMMKTQANFTASQVSLLFKRG